MIHWTGRHTSLAAGLATALLTLGVHGAASAAYFENFDAATSPLESNAGWTKGDAGKDSWTVSGAAGYTGNGAEITSNTVYHSTFEAGDIVTTPGVTFEAKMRITGAESRFANPWIIVRGTVGGVEGGVGLRFANGGSNPQNDGTTSSIQRMNTSSTGWFNGNLDNSTVVDGNGDTVRWLPDTWYTIQFKNLLTDSPTLTIFETDDPSTVIVDGFDLINYGTFSQIDTITLRETGVTRATLFDDLRIVVPEPASMALLGLGGLMAVARGRRRA